MPLFVFSLFGMCCCESSSLGPETEEIILCYINNHCPHWVFLHHESPVNICADAQQSFQMVYFLSHVIVLISVMLNFRKITPVFTYFTFSSHIFAALAICDTGPDWSRVNMTRQMAEHKQGMNIDKWLQHNIVLLTVAKHCYMHLKHHFCKQEVI